MEAQLQKGILLLWFCGLASCVSNSPTESGMVTPREPAAYDMVQLRHKTGLQQPIQELGFFEKSFDACQFAKVESKGHCGQRFLTVVNFRLRCRDSEDTVSAVATQLTPVTTNNVQWKLAGAQGSTKTDRDGYGQVELVTSSSIKGQRFVLTVGNQFLGKDISEVSEIIVPNYWCKQHLQSSQNSTHPQSQIVGWAAI